jgi:hypothetical protein
MISFTSFLIRSEEISLLKAHAGTAGRIEAGAGLVVLDCLPKRFDKQPQISGHIGEGAERELNTAYNF